MDQEQRKRFERLRDWAQELTGEPRWDTIVGLLDGWSKDDFEQVVLPYLIELLREHESPRAAPERWLTFDESGSIVVHPAWHLARTWRPPTLTSERLITLVQSPHLSRLTTLNLGRNRLGKRGAAALAKSRHLSALTTLDLSFNGIGVDGGAAIAQARALSKLTELGLRSNQLGDEGVIALAKSRHLNHLTTLNLSHNEITDEGAAAIAKSPVFKKLTKLYFSDNLITDEGAAALAQSPYLNEAIKAQWRR